MEMLSALQGQSASASALSPHTGLLYPRITQRCAHLRMCFASLPLKELHQFFPHLLANIFGFDRAVGGGGGWALRHFSVRLHGDFPSLLHFLSPQGELFKLMARLEAEGFLYEFPVCCLPPPTQQALAEGVVPPFYGSKIQLSFSLDPSPTHILLSAMEFYFFHFAYFLIYSQTAQPPSPPPPIPVTDSLYTHILDTYLSHLLPHTGTLPSPLTSSPRQGPPPEHTHYALPPSPPPLGLLKTNGGPSSLTFHPSHPHTGADSVQSETFVQTLVEFWLNQNSYNGGQGNLLAHAQSQFTPNEEHLLLLRRLLKQVHYFANGFSLSPSTPLLSPLTPLTDALRSSLLPLFLQRRVYRFLRHSFRHMPLDTHFRYILELWLTYVQPWRYTDPSRPSAENKESLETLPRKWRVFVLENFPFYSSLLVELLGRSFQLVLTSDPGVTLLYRTTKVFAQPGLMGFIEYGESLLLHTEAPPSAPYHRHSPPLTTTCSLKAVLADLEGHTHTYSPLFSPHTSHAIQALLVKIGRARAVLAHCSPSPHTPPQPHITLTPPSSPSSTHTQPTPAKRSWLQSVWQGVVDVFSEDSGHAHFAPPPSSNPRKLLSLLDATEAYLRAMFQVKPLTPSPGGSPLLGRAVLPPSPFPPSPSPHPPTPPTSLTPEYVQGTSHLTPRGKLQVIHGLRKCSNMDVCYHGDPMLQPIRSFENATLVRRLYHISCFLNERYSLQLAAIGSSDRLLSKLLQQLLSLPPPSPHIQHSSQESSPPHTPTSRMSAAVIPLPSHPPTPRINLRPLASYYTLSLLSILILLVWLLATPLWLLLLLASLFLFLYCCSRLLLSRGGDSRKRR